jgi:hypothetical protein
MPDPRFAGPYVPGLVQIIVGAPVGALGAAVIIPNLPQGATFPLLITGRAADNFVNASQTTDSASLTVGADGEAVANISFDKSGAITISLMASSLNNLAFSAAHALMTNSVQPVFFTFPVTIKDPNATGDLVTGANCLFQRAPDYQRGAAEGTNAWTLLSPALRILHGARIF